MESKEVLLLGDCIQKLKEIPSGSVDMVLADPPYGTTRCRWDSPIPFAPLWDELRRVVKKDGAILLFCGEPFGSALRLSNPKEYRYDWVWQKTSPTGFLNARRQPLRDVENIAVFYRSPPLYIPQKTSGHTRKVSSAYSKRNCRRGEIYGEYGATSYDSTERYPTQVLRFKSDKQREAYHPTQKPVALLEYLIKTYTLPGQTVLDVCMGSGSTGVAALRAGRKFIGIELSAEYYAVATRRITGERPE